MPVSIIKRCCNSSHKISYSTGTFLKIHQALCLFFPLSFYRCLKAGFLLVCSDSATWIFCLIGKTSLLQLSSSLLCWKHPISFALCFCVKTGLIHISLGASEIKYVDPGKKAVTWELMKISVHKKEGNTVHVMVTYFAFGHRSALNLSPPQVSSLSSLFNSINTIVDLQPNST